MTIKVVDSKGRVALGNRFVGQTVIIDDSDPDRIVVTPAVVIPAREAWLYKNELALGSVRRGLADAKKRNYRKKPPDLDADARFVVDLDD